MSNLPTPARWVTRYLFATVTIAVTTALLNVWRASLGTPLMALLYLIPVGLSTALWGLGPGVLSAVWAFLAFNFYFIEPYLTLVVHRTEDTLVLLVFLVVAVVISQLIGRARAGLAAAQAREREAARFYETETRARVLEESDRLKSAVLSSVSHELRTPLATIKAAATSLRSGEVAWDSASRAELLGAIDDEADHLNRLVGNLLDMSRIEGGALRPSRQWNLMQEIVSGVVERLRTLTAQHRLEVDLPDDLPLVPVDYVQMEQVFTNLISNCVKYAPPGSLIRVHARENGKGSLEVQVSNQGPHVPEADLERIFDKFYRITAADRVTGTGLGLSICKGIVEAHGGRIWAENLPIGIAFAFTLPLLWDGNPPPGLPPEAEPL